MAAYSADIAIQVKGKAQLNQLESQLKRTQKVLNQLNKQLNFRAKVQAIRLDTRQANTAISNLEKRINRLGRTINVNLRVNEKEGKKASGGSNVAVVTNPGPALAAAKALVPISKALTNEAQELLDAENKRKKAIEDLIASKQRETAAQERLNKAVRQQKKLEASTDNRTAANFFGKGTTRDAGLKQVAKEIRFAQQSLDGLRTAQTRYTSAVVESSKAWQKVKGGIKAAEQAAASATRRQKRNAGLRKAAVGGAAAGAIQIPGLGGAVTGAGLGFAASGGNPLGAAVGATAAVLAEATGALAGFANEAAKTGADLQKLEMALRSVTGSGADFNQALRQIRTVVDAYNAPLDQATAQFTKLAAAGKASGFSIEELGDVYKGLAAANKALGGDSERLAGILLATTQVFSKGKVQAEELRGQIGERLPGAFALFAEATGRTTKELDKALNDGEVSLEDFITFARDLFDKYDKDAQKIGDSPAEAGARLEKALTDMKAALGPALAEMGAMFQDFATNVIQILTPLGEYLANLFNLGQMGSAKAYQKSLADLVKLDASISAVEATLETADGSALPQINANLDSLNEQRQKLLKKIALQNASLGVQEPKDNPVIKETATTPTATTSSGGRGRTPRDDTDRALELQRILQQQIQLQQTLNGVERERLLLVFDLEDRLKTIRDLQGVNPALLESLSALSEQLYLLEDQEVVVETIGEKVENVASQYRDAILPLEDQRRLLEAKLNGTEKEVRLQIAIEQATRGLNPVLAEQVELRMRANAALQEQLEKQAQLQALFDSIGSSIENGILSSINAGLDALTGGVEDLDEALQKIASDTLKQIGQALIRYGLANIGGSGVGIGDLIGKLFKAEGGPVTGNSPYVVGEEGPELFIPGASGTIIDAQTTANALARYNGAKGKNSFEENFGIPGSRGSSGGGTTVINYNGPTLKFNGEDYVPTSAIPEIIDQAAAKGAKAGEQRTFAALRNSRSQRSRVGL